MSICSVGDQAEAWIRKLPVLQEILLVRPPPLGGDKTLLPSASPLPTPYSYFGWEWPSPQRAMVGICFLNLTQDHHCKSPKWGLKASVPLLWLSVWVLGALLACSLPLILALILPLLSLCLSPSNPVLAGSQVYSIHFWTPWFYVVVLVDQSCLTLCGLMDCSPPGSSVHGILQARVLEWVATPFSRGSAWPRDRTRFSCTAGGFFTVWATREALWF